MPMLELREGFSAWILDYLAYMWDAGQVMCSHTAVEYSHTSTVLWSAVFVSVACYSIMQDWLRLGLFCSHAYIPRIMGSSYELTYKFIRLRFVIIVIRNITLIYMDISLIRAHTALSLQVECIQC